MGTQAYRTLSGSFEDRSGRVFFNDALTKEEAELLLQEALCDPEDATRLELLRRGLGERTVSIFVVHRTIGAPDVIQAFLRMSVDGAATKVFACTVISRQRLEHDLESVPFVLEDLSTQVTSTADLTLASLEAALQAWVERILPGGEIPGVALDRWGDWLPDTWFR